MHRLAILFLSLTAAVLGIVLSLIMLMRFGPLQGLLCAWFCGAMTNALVRWMLT